MQLKLNEPTMGNSSIGSMSRNVQCFDPNLSRNSVASEFWDVQAISTAYRDNSIATAVIMLLFILVGLPSNIIIIVSIIQQKLYRETTHILLLNLAISDTLVCLLVMPPMIVTGFAGGYIFGDSDYVRCQVCKTGIIFVALTVFAVNILGVITLDRFIVIKFPLRHDNFVTVPRVIIIVIFLWMLSIFEAVLPLFGFGEITFAFSLTACSVNLYGEGKLTSNINYMILLVGLALIPLVIIIVFNIWLACLVSKQIKIVYRTRRSFGNKEELRQYNEGLRKQIHKKKNRKQMVLVRAFGAILLSTVIVWAPLVFHTVISIFVDSFPLGIFSFVFISFLTHSVLHSLMEACFIPEIKMTFKKVLGLSFLHEQLKRLLKKKRKESIAVGFDLDIDEEERGCSSRLRGYCELCSLAVIPGSPANISDEVDNS